MVASSESIWSDHQKRCAVQIFSVMRSLVIIKLKTHLLESKSFIILIHTSCNQDYLQNIHNECNKGNRENSKGIKYTIYSTLISLTSPS